LLLGVIEFLNFAVDAGAIGDLEAEALLGRGEQALHYLAANQAGEQTQEDPVIMFVGAIPAVLAAGRAHLTSRDGNKPSYDDPSIFGWRNVHRETPVGISADRAPHGDRLGWLVDEQNLTPTQWNHRRRQSCPSTARPLPSRGPQLPWQTTAGSGIARRNR
jgi:hypothetical protein